MGCTEAAGADAIGDDVVAILVWRAREFGCVTSKYVVFSLLGLFCVISVRKKRLYIEFVRTL